MLSFFNRKPCESLKSTLGYMYSWIHDLCYYPLWAYHLPPRPPEKHAELFQQAQVIDISPNFYSRLS